MPALDELTAAGSAGTGLETTRGAEVVGARLGGALAAKGTEDAAFAGARAGVIDTADGARDRKTRTQAKRA